jgi:hypothetical protein
MTAEGRAEERARRIGVNEALFRKLNEQLKGLAEQFELEDDLLLVCECGHAECSKRIQVPAARYEEIRADPMLFAITPGHELEEVEFVVAEHARFSVVRKRSGTPAEVAEAERTRLESGRDLR